MAKILEMPFFHAALSRSDIAREARTPFYFYLDEFQNFVAEVKTLTEGRGVDVILDVVGAKYLQRNIEALADGGRLVIIGLQGGTRAELDINGLLRKRAGVLATALRSRPSTGPGSKAEIVEQVREHLWPMISGGRGRLL